MEEFKSLAAEELYLLFDRDLSRLESEIKTYSAEKNLWITSGDITNSAGNLTLHLVGNLRHFVGHVLGNSGYVRKRDLEFSDKNIPLETLLEQIEETKREVKSALKLLTDDQLGSIYPIDVMNKSWTTRQFLMHLSGHLNYHLGQINYHGRSLDKS